MHRALKLQPHKHTGKILPHSHTSYWVLTLLVLFLGCLLVEVNISLRQSARADSFFITATKPAPIPASAAQITAPKEGWTQSTPYMTVSGRCPVVVPTVGIVIYRNNTMAGSGPCTADGTFSIPISLDAGANTLLARILTITGDYGIDGTAIHGIYQVPPYLTQDTTSHVVVPGPSPITITPDVSFIVFGPRKPATWSGTITGGNAPYNILLNWGDGVTERYSNQASGRHSFDHIYTKMRAYSVTIEVMDAQKHYQNVTIAAVTPALPASGLTIIDNAGPSEGIPTSMVWAIYTAYLSLLAAFALLWIIRHHQDHPLFFLAKRRHKSTAQHA